MRVLPLVGEHMDLATVAHAVLMLPSLDSYEKTACYISIVAVHTLLACTCSVYIQVRCILIDCCY
jgi:hypothetical protein